MDFTIFEASGAHELKKVSIIKPIKFASYKENHIPEGISNPVNISPKSCSDHVGYVCFDPFKMYKVLVNR